MRIAHKEHLNAVKVASTDATRYVLNGVYMEETEKGLRAVATDGRRLAIVESEGGLVSEDFPAVPGMDTAPNTGKSAIIPNETITRTLKSIPRKVKLPVLSTALVKMSDDQTTLCTTDLSNANVIPSRNIMGTFPNYSAVLPKDEPTFKIGMTTELLIETLQLALANGGDVVCMEFWKADQPMRIVVQNKSREIKTTIVQMPVKL